MIRYAYNVMNERRPASRWARRRKMITSGAAKKSSSSAAILIVVFLSTMVHGSSHTVAPDDDGSNLVGNWTGDSICVGNRPACHDEQVIYHIKKAPDSSGNVTITADKIVNGKPELMGILDFKYDSEKRTLVCDFTRGNTHGLWELTVEGTTMEGTLMLLPDKSLVRRVKVHKETVN
jgi:hypothetical protein